MNTDKGVKKTKSKPDDYKLLGDVFSISEREPPRNKALLIVAPFTSSSPQIPFEVGYFNGFEFKSKDGCTIMNVLHYAELKSHPENDYDLHSKAMRKIETTYIKNIVFEFLEWMLKNRILIGETEGKAFMGDDEELLDAKELVSKYLNIT